MESKLKTYQYELILSLPFLPKPKSSIRLLLSNPLQALPINQCRHKIKCLPLLTYILILTQTYLGWSQNGQEINYLLKPSGGHLRFLSLVVHCITVNSEPWKALQTQGMSYAPIHIVDINTILSGQEQGNILQVTGKRSFRRPLLSICFPQ